MGGAQLIAILRGFSAEQSVEIALRAWDVGSDLVEVPVQSEQAGSRCRTSFASQKVALSEPARCCPWNRCIGRTHSAAE